MYADVERFSFHRGRHFLRVLQQQGRVSLPADGNEQVAILLDYLQALAQDVIGPYGTPADPTRAHPGEGFKITPKNGGGFTIGPGRFWVDGFLCENDAKELDYNGQPDYPHPPPPQSGFGLVYLDVWERHVAAAQDDAIREVALGGPDTCSRSQLVWQVKVVAIQRPTGDINPTTVRDTHWPAWRKAIEAEERGRLAVRVDKDMGPSDPCQVPAGAGYFGNENQLYRVEIHQGWGKDSAGNDLVPTFKWSRDNGSAIYPLSSIEGTVAVLLDPPLDCRKALATATLVEIVDDDASKLGRAGLLTRVVEVDDEGDDVVVHLKNPVPASIPRTRHPLLRRWDHPDVSGGGEGVPAQAKDGALQIAEGADTWLALEDGIKIRFAPGGEAVGTARYRTGDYWTFPARAVLGDVLWPLDAQGKRAERPPHGVNHHYAPLAAFTFGTGVPGDLVDCRLSFAPLAALLP